MKRQLALLIWAAFLVISTASSAAAVPERVVSLVPSVTESIFAIDAGEQLVGVTSWCDYPEEAQEREVVGDAFNLNMEVLLSLEPDAVIGDSNLVAHHMEALKDVGIEMFTIEPLTYDEVAESLEKLGAYLGQEEQAAEAAERMRTRRDEILADVPDQEGPLVFVETWNEPISSAGPGSFLHELLEMAGASNIAHDMKEPWGQFSEELVIERDPEVILLTNFNYDEVMQRDAWRELTAVQNERVYEVDPDVFARTSTRLADALEALVDILY